MSKRPHPTGKLIILIGFMWFAYFLNYGDRQAIFAMFGSLKTDLAMTDSQLGLTGSAFLWVYGICCPLAGLMADRFSKRLMVVLSLFIWSIVTLATGFATSALMLLALRAAMGVSESLYMPAAISLTANATPVNNRSMAVSLLTTGQIVGVVAGSWFGGYMAEQGQWRWAFFCLGAIGIVYSLPYAIFLSQFEETVEGNNKTEIHDSSGPGLFALFQIPSYCLLCVAFPIFVFGLWMLYSWLPSFLGEKFLLNKAEAGFYGSVFMQAGSLAGIFLGGYLADYGCRYSRASRFWLLVLSLGCCSPFAHLIGNSSAFVMTQAWMFAFGLFSGFLMGNIFPAAFEVVPAGLRASAVGILNFFGAIVSGFAPLVAGRWKQTIGIERMLSAVAVVYMAGALMVIVAIRFYFAQDWAKVQSHDNMA